jgi:hypothetical protein
MLQPWIFTPPSIEDRSWWGRVACDPALAGWRERHATALAATGVPPRATAADWLHIRRTNDRGPSDRMVKQTATGLLALTMQRGMLGPDGDDDRLLDWYWQAAHQASWTMSPHLGGGLPRVDRPVIDLGAAMLALHLAEGLEVLAPWLRRQAPGFIESIIATIDRNVIGPYGSGVEVWWDSRKHLNNWLGVCAGSILGACRSLAALGEARPEAEARARRGVALYLDASFSPGGECDEGLGYWSYGMAFACAGLSRLAPDEVASLCGPRLRICADYPRRAHLGEDRFIAANDGSDHCPANPALVPWLAATTGSAWLWAWAARHPGRELGTLRTIDGLMRLAGAGTAPELRSGTGSELLPDQQIAILRRDRLTAVLTGGHNAENHNHNDLGNIQVMLDGRAVVPEIGYPSPYPADFFGPRRYSYLAASSRGHSCPIIAGCEQRDGRDAQAVIVAWTPDGEEPTIVLELAAAYPAEAGLRSWRRSLTSTAEAMMLEDRFAAAAGAAIEHTLWFADPPEALREGSLLTVRCGSLRVVIEPAPATWTVQSIDPKPLNLTGPGTALHRLALSYVADAAGGLRICTRFCAG